KQSQFLEPVGKLRGVLRRGILAVAEAARPEHPRLGLAGSHPSRRPGANFKSWLPVSMVTTSAALPRIQTRPATAPWPNGRGPHRRHGHDTTKRPHLSGLP